MDTELFNVQQPGGFEIRIMENPIMQPGKAVLMLHPKDAEHLKPLEKGKSISEQVEEQLAVATEVPLSEFSMEEMNEIAGTLQEKYSAYYDYRALITEMEASLWTLYHAQSVRKMPDYCIVSTTLKPILSKTPTSVRNKVNYKTVLGVPVVWAENFPFDSYQFVFKQSQIPNKQ